MFRFELLNLYKLACCVRWVEYKWNVVWANEWQATGVQLVSCQWHASMHVQSREPLGMFYFSTTDGCCQETRRTLGASDWFVHCSSYGHCHKSHCVHSFTYSSSSRSTPLLMMSHINNSLLLDWFVTPDLREHVCIYQLELLCKIKSSDSSTTRETRKEQAILNFSTTESQGALLKLFFKVIMSC